jgi:hypothetical protein
MLIKHRHLTLVRRTIEAIKKYPDNSVLGDKIRSMWQREIDTCDLLFEEKTEIENSWVCNICGKGTFEVEYDYMGSGTNHLKCELKQEIDNENK